MNRRQTIANMRRLLPGRIHPAEAAVYGAPGGARFQQVQVLNPPGSEKDIAEGKDVYREVESEESWMWETYCPWANLWSDGQKPHMRLCTRVRLQNKSKPNNYTESCMINVADRWRKGNVWYPRRSVRNALKGVTKIERLC